MPPAAASSIEILLQNVDNGATSPKPTDVRVIKLKYIKSIGLALPEKEPGKKTSKTM